MMNEGEFNKIKITEITFYVNNFECKSFHFNTAATAAAEIFPKTFATHKNT